MIVELAFDVAREILQPAAQHFEILAEVFDPQAVKAQSDDARLTLPNCRPWRGGFNFPRHSTAQSLRSSQHCLRQSQAARPSAPASFELAS